MKLFHTITRELDDYLNRSIELSDGVSYSEYKIKKRLALFQNRTYPTGKLDKQNKYKYWYDITTSRINARVKNIDFDTRDVRAESTVEGYELADLMVNIKLAQWMKDTGQAKEINDAVEEFSDLGNVLFKKGKEGYKRCDWKNTYMANPAAETVDETPIIERFLLSQSELRAKVGVWKNVEKVIDECKNKFFSQTVSASEQDKTSPYYEIFERNGEVSVYELKEAQGKEPNERDADTYVLAKVIVAGLDNGEGTTGVVLFAEEYPSGKKLSDYFAEGHAGLYTGRWWREGVRELLFDCQTRANEIGNQIARGLEFAAKKLLASKEKTAAQNILTGLRNGDILRGEFQSIELRMDGFDQLLADWNRNLQNADDVTGAQEWVRGEMPASGTPDRLVARLDANAGKLFVFLREKLAIPFGIIFERWLVPQLVKEMKADEFVKLAGRTEAYEKFVEMVARSLYLRNLIKLGPHPSEVKPMFVQRAMQELMARPELLVEFARDFWDGYKPTVRVDIVGEGITLDTDLQSAAQFVPLIADPVRRDALVEAMMKKRLRWLDIDSLPKTQHMPQVPQPQQAQQQGQQRREPQPVAA